MHVSAVLVYSNHLNKVKCMNPFAQKPILLRAYICPYSPWIFPNIFGGLLKGTLATKSKLCES